METEELIRRFIRAGLATPEQLRGCSAADIEQIEATLGLHLPASYRDFLLIVGRRAGQFYATGHLTYPDLLANRQRAEAMLAEEAAILGEERNPFRLPTDAVVFLAWEAHFRFLRTHPPDADPPVFDYLGFDEDPAQIADHFSGHLDDALTGYEQVHGVACCFCDQRLALDGFDPCVLTLRSYVHGPPDARRDQDLYCHAACLSAAIHPSTRPWVLAAVRSD